MPKYAQDVWNKLKSPASADVFKYAKTQREECYEGEKVKDCLLANIVDRVEIFGDQTIGIGGPKYILATMEYEPDTGNALHRRDFIFKLISKNLLAAVLR